MAGGQLAFVGLALKPIYAALAKERQGARNDLKAKGTDIVAERPQSKKADESRERAAKRADVYEDRRAPGAHKSEP